MNQSYNRSFRGENPSGLFFGQDCLDRALCPGTAGQLYHRNRSCTANVRGGDTGKCDPGTPKWQFQKRSANCTPGSTFIDHIVSFYAGVFNVSAMERCYDSSRDMHSMGHFLQVDIQISFPCTVGASWDTYAIYYSTNP